MSVDVGRADINVLDVMIHRALLSESHPFSEDLQIIPACISPAGSIASLCRSLGSNISLTSSKFLGLRMYSCILQNYKRGYTQA